MKNLSFRIKIRLILWSIVVLAGLVLVYFAVLPFGRATYNYHPSGHAILGGKGFFGNFTPTDRIDTTGDNLKIIGGSVYFSLFTPRRFEKAKMTIVFRGFDYESYPIMEAGVMVDPILRNYRLYSISNYIIDHLAGEWKTKKEGDLMLLQKEPKYSSIDNLLDNVPPKGELAFYNYQYNFPYQINDYQASSKIISLPDLRGAYQFYTYINNETLNWSVDFYDLNQNADKNGDAVKIYVYDSQQKSVAEYDLPDDGNREDNGQMSGPRNLKISLPNLPAGVYKVEVKANDDVVSRQIQTTQTKLAFISHLWLYNHSEAEIGLWTDGSFLKLKAADPLGVGEMLLNGNSFFIPETYKQYKVPFSDSQTINELKVLRPETVVETSGVFSFSPEALFNPDTKKIEAGANLAGLKEIVARYNPPVSLGIWKQATVEMDISDVYREKGQTNFMISIPGLLAENQIVGAEIKSISLELTGKSLIDKIKEYVE